MKVNLGRSEKRALARDRGGFLWLLRRENRARDPKGGLVVFYASRSPLRVGTVVAGSATGYLLQPRLS